MAGVRGQEDLGPFIVVLELARTGPRRWVDLDYVAVTWLRGTSGWKERGREGEAESDRAAARGDRWRQIKPAAAPAHP
jgi:hypothetical protein